MMFDRRLLAPHALAHWAAQTPDAVALQHVDGDRLTYAELHDQSRRWAAALSGLGVGAGTHVGTMVPNVFDAHRAMLGLSWLRAVEVPLNTAYTGRMLDYALDLADVEVLLVAREFVDRVDTEAQVVVLDEFGAGDRAGDFAGPDVWDVACLLFTSGTTGPSKAVVSPWGFVYQMWSWVPEDTLAPGDGVFNPMPLFHNSGRSGFNYALSRGARFVIRDKFSGSQLWDDVRATNCTTVALVGPMTSVLWSAPPKPDDADNPVRNVVLGPMIPDMDAFERRFGVRVCTCYGQTEIGAPVATGWDHGPWANTGSVRPDWPGPEVRLVDEHDEPVPVGEVGEMVVRTAAPWATNLGYYKMPEQSVAAWRNGWFHTGDAFRCDDDGRYYFVDRLKDTVRRRGENISSLEVEGFVLEHPDVVECAVVGAAAEHGDEEVLAAVIVKDPGAFDPAALAAFLADRMPAFMVPRYIAVVGDLPRNETTGRVRKPELRALGLHGRAWDRLTGSA